MHLNAIVFMPTDSSSLSGMTEKNKSFKTNIPMNNTSVKIYRAKS